MKRKGISLLLLGLFLVSCVSQQKRIQMEREKDPKYQYSRGNYYLNIGQPDEAIKYFKKALALAPRHYLSFNALGLAYSIKREFEESMVCFEKCLEINPQFTEARNNLGMVYQVMGLLDKAEETYQTALLDREYNSKELLYFGLAQIHFSRNKLEEALDDIQIALKANSRMALAHNGKGQILEKLNRMPKAIESYQQALKIVPDDVSFSFNLAVAYFKTGEFGKARELFEKILPRVQDEEIKQQIKDYLRQIREG
ncbi:MAG: tetratricopeptide repeat protein [Candidatus Aminicenantales bacterium]